MVVYRYRKEDTVKRAGGSCTEVSDVAKHRCIDYDGEYDEDRYDSDPEYAEGVDDAMDELDEDG